MEMKSNTDVKPFVAAIEQMERMADDYSAFIKKLKAQLSKGKTGITQKSDTLKQVTTLLAAAKALNKAPDAVNLSDFVATMETELDRLKIRIKNDFPAALRDSAKAAQLEFSQVSDGFEVGPFRLIALPAKELATLQFAKQDIVLGLPMNAVVITESALRTQKLLLEPPVEVERFSTELQEAMRVSLARQNKLSKQDLRAELPVVIRELVLMRQKAQRTIGDELLACRLIVEIKTLIQSDQNMRANQQFSLETAVLENTKNPKKSLFIPNDLSRSCGEGTYFQAIIFKTA